MADYKEMYLTMLEASERAINILIEAQRKCEDIYIDEKNQESIIPLEISHYNKKELR